MYSFSSRIRYSEVGQDSILKIDALINYFQDCSTFQSEDLGVGIEWLTGQKRCWIVNSWQLKIRRLPKLGEEVVISTWPNSLKGVLGVRNFTMADKDGNILAVANSLWSYFDIESHRPAKIDDKIIQTYVMEAPYEEEWEGRKIMLPTGLVAEAPFLVEKSHLDTNKHVNNGQYIQMAMAYLPQDFPLKSLRVEYKKEAVLGDAIVPHIRREDGCIIVVLGDEGANPYAVVEFKTV